MGLTIEAFYTKRDTGQQWDIGEICEQLTFNWELEGRAGSLDMSYIRNKDIDIVEGDIISIRINDVNIFYGWVFKKEINAYDSVKLKVFDIKRYLAYKDVDVTGNETIDKFFERVCKMANIPYKVVHTSNYIIPSKIHDGETYESMLNFAIDMTFINTGERFCVRANGKVLELVSCAKSQLDIVIGDGGILSDFSYSTDIENTYTAFKLQKDVGSEEQKKLTTVQEITNRKNFVYQDPTNVKKWGVLQWYEKHDAKWTDAQLQDRLTHLAQTKNKQTKTLQLNCCIGDVRCIPGNMVALLISDLENEKVAQGTFVTITSAKHVINHGEYEMTLDVEVS